MRLILFLMQVPSALMVLYLDVLSGAALVGRRRPPATSPHHRFAVCIPAHNEEVLLPRLLQSLSCIEYPRELYDIHVVADNCTDRTAEVAANEGATVHERCNLELLGKGYALEWLLARIQGWGLQYDAVVIVDADSTVSGNLLDVMNRHLARGDDVIQSYYGVKNGQESWSSALDAARLAVFNDLRPRGRDALRLSAGLRGNGMCFRSNILERVGWKAFTLAEDVEMHLALVGGGTRVTYAGDAAVLGEMPTSLRQAQSQNVRWERGRLQMLRAFGPRLVMQGIRRRDPVQLDAVAEQLVPPLSVLTAYTGLFFLLTVFTRMVALRRLAVSVLGGQLGYVATGLYLVKAERRVYLSLLRAPFYVVWKVWIYVTAAARLHDNRWVRTSRAPLKER